MRFFANAALLLAIFAVGGLAGRAERLPCAEAAAAARDAHGRFIWADNKTLQQRAVVRAIPDPPPSLRVEGVVLVDVLIDAEGKVRCAKARKGHPLLRKPAADAARKWSFRPFTAEGRVQPVLGRLEIRFGAPAR